jgi:predicted ATPase
MIIELQNFGPIKSFKFDTSKDMHAIFGKNNIGKSYAISAVYLILKNLKEMDSFIGSNLIYDSHEKDSLVKLINEKLEISKKKKCVVSEQIANFYISSLNLTFIQKLNKSFKNTFDFYQIQNLLTSDTFKIVLQLDVGVFTINLDDKRELRIISLTFSHELEIYNPEVTSKLTFDYQFQVLRVQEFVEIIPFFNLKIHEEIVHFANNIYFLPASRSGLYTALNSFGAIFAELARSRTFLTSKIEIPSISEPISDYFLSLNNIDDTVISETYSKYFETIEKDILKGTIGFDKRTRKYHYIPNANPDMVFDLSATSSMISEIAPIIAHLKYIIPTEKEDKKSIFFIEEPEAHLHPEIQILLLEYFVKLSKGNVKIVMTSHSNYIFNKLSNLLIAKKIDKEKLSVSLMKMTPEGSVIEDGAMQIDEYGIEDNNFVDVAEQLYEERMSLLEKL